MSNPPSASDPAANIRLSLEKSQVQYVNFCRVTATPEEVILDLGLQSIEPAAGAVWEAPQRISFSLYTAKRLLDALRATLQQYEATFGNVEPDIEKRVLPSAK